MTVNVPSLLVRPDPRSSCMTLQMVQKARKGACNLTEQRRNARCIDNVHPVFQGLSVLMPLSICHTNILPSDVSICTVLQWRRAVLLLSVCKEETEARRDKVVRRASLLQGTDRGAEPLYIGVCTTHPRSQQKPDTVETLNLANLPKPQIMFFFCTHGCNITE